MKQQVNPKVSMLGIDARMVAWSNINANHMKRAMSKPFSYRSLRIGEFHLAYKKQL